MFLVVISYCSICFFCFFFNDTSTTEIYTLSLHDALPIFVEIRRAVLDAELHRGNMAAFGCTIERRSEEHTSELQSQSNLVCRLLLEKKNNDQPDIESEHKNRDEIEISKTYSNQRFCCQTL